MKRESVYLEGSAPAEPKEILQQYKWNTCLGVVADLCYIEPMQGGSLMSFLIKPDIHSTTIVPTIFGLCERLRAVLFHLLYRFHFAINFTHYALRITQRR